jgi:hypothetical protein
VDGALAVILGIVLLAAIVRYLNWVSQLERRQERERKAAEARRLSDCEDVVRYFANFHGYLARPVISRAELEEQIDSGISADDLGRLIERRMNAVDGLELGYQELDGISTPVVLPDQYRDKHLYVVGKSGYGKTNFLRYLILQDIDAGHGVGVLAPEFEMLQEEILPFIPDYRKHDVIYFNPADVDCPVVLNPLHLDEDADIDLQVDETFTILQRVVGEGGPRMDEILRHSLYALTERPGSTLLDVERLLDRSNDELRIEIVRSTEDDRTRSFFASTYLQMPRDAHLPILNRIGRFVRARYIRNCLCPPKLTTLSPEEVTHRLLNIRSAMDGGNILLFNLSDGLLGEMASQLIGQLIVSKFQTATMSRANTAKSERRPFYLYLDEFQNFCGVASKSYERILSRARKYGLGLILAHQQTGQIPLELMREILGNVSTLVSFQLSQPDAVRMSREFVTQVDFEVEPIPPQEFLQLNVGEAWVKIGRNAFPMSVPKVDEVSDQNTAREIIESSRFRYGIPRVRMKPTPRSDDVQPGEDPLADLDPEGIFD